MRRSRVWVAALSLAALSALSGCQRAVGPSGGEHKRLRPAYVRLSAALSSTEGLAALTESAQRQRGLAEPAVAAARVILPEQVAAGGRGGDSWIDQAARATEAATKRQHELQKEALAKAIERRVASRRQQLEAEFSGTLAEQQKVERSRAEESRAAATERIAPRLSDLRLRIWLLERRKQSLLGAMESERKAEEAARAELEALEGELRQRLATIDAELAARLQEIETAQRAAMERSLHDYREREWARAGEIGEAGAQRLEDVSRQAHERLAALAAVIEPASLSVELPPLAAERTALGREQALGLAVSTLDRNRRDLAELVRWQTAQRIKAAGRARGYDIRFQRPPGADWPDVTEQARQWLRAGAIR